MPSSYAWLMCLLLALALLGADAASFHRRDVDDGANGWWDRDGANRVQDHSWGDSWWKKGGGEYVALDILVLLTLLLMPLLNGEGEKMHYFSKVNY